MSGMDYRWVEDKLTDIIIHAKIERLEAMIPKTRSASSGQEHENKGDDMGTTGMRTERVTLEVTHSESSSAASWAWENWPIPGQSVRVVEEPARTYFPTFTVQDVSKIQNDANKGVMIWKNLYTKALVERNEARDERDAAIREREELRRSFHSSEEAGTRLLAERNASLDDAAGLRARVAELEGENGPLGLAATMNFDEWKKAEARVAELESHIIQRDVALESVVDRAAKADNRVASLESQLESVADRAAAAETALESAPAASDAAGTEAVAWGVMVHRDALLCVPFTVIEAADHFVRLNGVNERMQVVPLYAAPQPAKGWLTPEEQEAILYLIANRSQFAPQTPHEARRNAASRVCHAILARSSPPEVVLPKRWEDMRSVIGDQRDADWLAALAASGVTVKEVGK